MTRNWKRADDDRVPMLTRRIGLVLALAIGAVTGCGSNGDPTPVRSYTLHIRTDDASDKYGYIAEDPIDLRVGDEVTFEMSNTGALIHDLQIVGPDGLAVAAAPPVASGGALSLTVYFDEVGYYQLNCLVDDHLTKHSMQALVEVVEA